MVGLNKSLVTNFMSICVGRCKNHTLARLRQSQVTQYYEVISETGDVIRQETALRWWMPFATDYIQALHRYTKGDIWKN